MLLPDDQYESLVFEKEAKDELYRLLEESEQDSRLRVEMDEAMKVFDEAVNVANL